MTDPIAYQQNLFGGEEAVVFGEELERRFCYRRSVRGDVERCEGCAKSYIDEDCALFCRMLRKSVWPNWVCKQWEMAF